MGRISTLSLLALSVLSVFVGVLCIVIALATALVDTVLLALATTYVQMAIAAFLVAIWFALLALFYELRERRTKVGQQTY